MKSYDEDQTAVCPDCETAIELDAELTLGQNITCPECWAYLKVVSLDPVELDWDLDDLEDFDQEDT